jgi:hypothetical protein
MKEQTKTLLKVGAVLVIPALFFVMGIAVGSADVEVQVKEIVKEVEVVKEVPVIEERVVVEEKIVYQDTAETVELVGLYNDSMTTITEAYITIFEVAESCASLYGQPVHNDYYVVYEFAKEYYNNGF